MFTGYFVSKNIPIVPTAFDGRSDYGPFVESTRAVDAEKAAGVALKVRAASNEHIPAAGKHLCSRVSA